MNEPSILYHCRHLFALYQFVWLRFSAHRGKRTILLIYDDDFAQSPFAKKLLDNGIFSRILLVKEPWNFDSYGEDTAEQFITDYYDKVFLQYQLTFDAVKKIYTACDLKNLFSVYCRLRGQPVTFLEQYEGQFADQNRYSLARYTFGFPMWLEELCRKYSALSGDGAHYTAKRVLFPRSPVEYPDRDINVDCLDEFYSLPDNCKRRILHCVSFPERIELRNVSLLLLNSPRWTKAVAGLERHDHYLPYLLLADYYFRDPDNVVMKDHPHAGSQGVFEHVIAKGYATLPAEIPIEFFGLLEGFHVRQMLSVNSTGNEKLKRFVEEERRLGTEYLENYRLLHRSFAALFVGEALSLVVAFRAPGLGETFLENLISCRFSTQTIDSPYALAFLEWETLMEYLSGREALLFQVVSLSIQKLALRENILSDTNEEHLFFLCEDVETKARLLNFQGAYTLPRTGLRIVVSGGGRPL